jgi:hypothetical protein
MDPITVGVGVGVVLLVGVAIAGRPQNGLSISLRQIRLREGEQTHLVAIPVRKGWGFGGFQPVPATVRHTSGKIVDVTPATVTTTAIAPDAIFAVRGALAGTGSITVSATSAWGGHPSGFRSGRIAVEVLARSEAPLAPR